MNGSRGVKNIIVGQFVLSERKNVHTDDYMARLKLSRAEDKFSQSAEDEGICSDRCEARRGLKYKLLCWVQILLFSTLDFIVSLSFIFLACKMGMLIPPVTGSYWWMKVC